MTDLDTARPTDRVEPGHTPDVPHPGERETPVPRLAVAGGVELSRLIALARLTPAQALEIGASALADAARRSQPNARSAASRPVTGPQLRFHRLVVGVDGRATLGSATGGSHDAPPPRAGTAEETLARVLADLAEVAPLHPGRVDPAAEQLRNELDRAGTALRDAGVHAAERMLRQAAAAIDRTAVRAELAALVRAIQGSAASGAGAAGDPSGGARETPARRAATREAPPQGTRTAIRRVGSWFLSALVLAAVILLEFGLLRDKVSTDVDLLLNAGGSGSSSSAAPHRDGVPIPAPAPAAAGSVMGVDLRPLAGCAAGAPCTLRLLVRVVPGADPQVVSWSYRIVDRCTGATGTAPGGSVTVPGKEGQASVVGTVRLPAKRAVAVVAVTNLPAAAASSPVLVGSCSSAPAG